MNKQIFVGIDISSAELCQRLFDRNKLPKNYDVRTLKTGKFEKYMSKAKPIICGVIDIDKENFKTKNVQLRLFVEYRFTVLIKQ